MRRREASPPNSDPVCGVRKPIGTAVWVTLLFGFLQRIIPIALDQLSIERDWLYSKVTGGLTWVGAIVIAAVAAGCSILKARKGEAIRRAIEGSRRPRTPSGEGEGARGARTRVTPLMLIVLLLGLVMLFAAPFVLGSVIAEVLGTSGR